MCFLSLRSTVINIFESLVVLNIENRTVKLTGLAYGQEFDNIFALSCREPKMSCNDAKSRDRA